MGRIGKVTQRIMEESWRRNYKRFVSILPVITMMALMLAGCGKQSVTTENTGKYNEKGIRYKCRD